MKMKNPACDKALLDRELEILFRRASEYLKLHEPRLLKKVPQPRRRPASAA